jgi:hypothetical protein
LPSTQSVQVTAPAAEKRPATQYVHEPMKSLTL